MVVAWEDITDNALSPLPDGKSLIAQIDIVSRRDTKPKREGGSPRGRCFKPQGLPSTMYMGNISGAAAPEIVGSQNRTHGISIHESLKFLVFAYENIHVRLFVTTFGMFTCQARSYGDDSTAIVKIWRFVRFDGSKSRKFIPPRFRQGTESVSSQRAVQLNCEHFKIVMKSRKILRHRNLLFPTLVSMVGLTDPENRVFRQLPVEFEFSNPFFCSNFGLKQLMKKQFASILTVFITVRHSSSLINWNLLYGASEMEIPKDFYPSNIAMYFRDEFSETACTRVVTCTLGILYVKSSQWSLNEIPIEPAGNVDKEKPLHFYVE